MVVLPDRHRLARRKALDLAALAEEPFVLPPRHLNRVFHDCVMEACQDAGFRPDVADEAFPASSATLLVAAGVGVSIVPAPMAKHLCQQGVVYRPLKDPPRLGLSLVWRESEPSEVAAAFIGLVRKASSFS